MNKWTFAVLSFLLLAPMLLNESEALLRAGRRDSIFKIAEARGTNGQPNERIDKLRAAEPFRRRYFEPDMSPEQVWFFSDISQ